MKKILCFGDSNTYGFNPSNFERYDEYTRWSGIIKNKLKNDFSIIENGCNNRTCYKNPIHELNSLYIFNNNINEKYEYIIIQIGINDVQFHYNTKEEELKNNLNELIKLAKLHSNKIIVLCPNIIKEECLKSNFNQLFNQESIELSKKLPVIYEKIASQNNCNYLDLNLIAEVSKYDGIHYDEKNHNKIAERILELIN